MFLAVEAVGVDLLVHDPRRDLDVGVGSNRSDDASAEAVAVVDVLASGRADRVDEAAEMGAVADNARTAAVDREER